MGSLIEGLGGAPTGYPPLPGLPPAEVGEYRQVVLIVVDGLGHEFLCRRRNESRLKELTRARLTSVFPSTTAAAITTFLTGVAPQQHGLTGWHMYFRELGTVLAVLPGTPRGGGALSKPADGARRLVCCNSVFDRLPVQSGMISPRRIAYSSFNLAHRGKARIVPFDTLDDFFLGIASFLRTNRNRKFIYAYWADLDRVAHETGTSSVETEKHFAAWEDGFRRFLKDVAGTGTLIVVTADHGFIDADKPHTVELADHPELTESLWLPLCGEKRVAYCYVKAERCELFESYVRAELGDIAELWRSSDLVDRGWFGRGAPHPELTHRIGDYALVMKENWIIQDWLPGESRYEHIGVHGGISETELGVPLIATSV
jgi:hypothetical protein